MSEDGRTGGPYRVGEPREMEVGVPAAPRIRRAQVVVLVGTLAFAVLALLVLTGSTGGMDAAVLRALRRLDDPGVPRGGQLTADIARDLTSLGGTSVLVLVVVLVAGYLAADRRLRDAAAVTVAAVGGVLLDVLLKLLFARERPSVVPHLMHAVSGSFPSGHSMLAAVIYPTMGALLARFAKRRRMEVIPIAAAVSITVLVGLSRMVLGVHHPTDVLAGWSVGAAWAGMSWLAVDRLARAGKVEGKASA